MTLLEQRALHDHDTLALTSSCLGSCLCLYLQGGDKADLSGRGRWWLEALKVSVKIWSAFGCYLIKIACADLVHFKLMGFVAQRRHHRSPDCQNKVGIGPLQLSCSINLLSNNVSRTYIAEIALSNISAVAVRVCGATPTPAAQGVTVRRSWYYSCHLVLQSEAAMQHSGSQTAQPSPSEKLPARACRGAQPSVTARHQTP